MFEFGSGTVWMTPVAGNLPTNPTPIQVGTLQDISLDISFDLKMLYGHNQFPESVARGKGKIAGKAKFGRFNSDMLNQMIFAQTRTTGMDIASLDEGPLLIPTTPFQITPAHAGTWILDQGVRNAATGVPFLKVALATTPTAGQYHVDPATGIYTFSTADNVSVISVLISYLYTTASGVKQAITNQLMGYQPVVQVTFRTIFDGKESVIILYSAVIGKLLLASKLDDYTIPEIDFEAFADASGKVMDIFAAE